MITRQFHNHTYKGYAYFSDSRYHDDGDCAKYGHFAVDEETDDTTELMAGSSWTSMTWDEFCLAVDREVSPEWV